MGFFEPPPEPEPIEPAELARPEWAPRFQMGTLPGVVALELVLAQKDGAAVFLGRVDAYPTGVELELRWVAPAARPGPGGMPWRAGMGGPMPDDMVRFGVRFSDGRQATNLMSPAFGPDAQNDLVLLPQRGGGFALRGVHTYWLWPLPPPGPVTWVCEWPALGIPETTVETDGQTFLDAASRAKVIVEAD